MNKQEAVFDENAEDYPRMWKVERKNLGFFLCLFSFLKLIYWHLKLY